MRAENGHIRKYALVLVWAAKSFRIRTEIAGTGLGLDEPKWSRTRFYQLCVGSVFPRILTRTFDKFCRGRWKPCKHSVSLTLYVSNVSSAPGVRAATPLSLSSRHAFV